LSAVFGVELVRADIEADAIDLLAGPIAEARARHVSRDTVFLFGGEDDWEAADRKVRDLALPDDARHRLLNDLERRAATLVREHWASIVALAEALLQKRRMGWEEVAAVIEGSGGKGDRHLTR
jgi:hypothetical protein